MVTQLNVTFSDAVTFPDYVSNAFRLRRTGPSGPTGDIFAGGVLEGSTLGLSFPYGNSLVDGNYELTLYSSKIVGANGNLDGNGDGIPGDDLVFTFHRLFGDANGDRRVDVTDFAVFRSVFGTPSLVFDFNNDGSINSADFVQFRVRFGLTI